MKTQKKALKLAGARAQETLGNMKYPTTYTHGNQRQQDLTLEEKGWRVSKFIDIPLPQFRRRFKNLAYYDSVVSEIWSMIRMCSRIESLTACRVRLLPDLRIKLWGVLYD